MVDTPLDLDALSLRHTAEIDPGLEQRFGAHGLRSPLSLAESRALLAEVRRLREQLDGVALSLTDALEQLGWQRTTDYGYRDEFGIAPSTREAAIFHVEPLERVVLRSAWMPVVPTPNNEERPDA